MSKRLIDSKLGDFKRIVVTFIMIFIMSIFIGSFIYVDNSLRPTITVLAETKAIELANRSINKSSWGNRQRQNRLFRLNIHKVGFKR